MKQADLVAEIEALVQDECVAAQRAVLKSWVRREIIRRHDRVEGEDVDFAMLCIYEQVEDTVEQVTRRYRPKPERSPDPQLTFEDYLFVQKVYMIERDGESTLVPTDQYTPAEVQWVMIDEGWFN